MNKIKNNRLILPFLILMILLVIPMAGYGFFNANRRLILGENPKRLPRIGNKLYFYEGKVLKGTYDCKNDDCALAKTTEIKGDVLNTNPGENFDTSIYDIYAFIQDGENIYFQNIKNNILISEIKSLINYGGVLNKKFLIVENSGGQYGLLNTESYSFQINTKYKYVGYLENEAGYVVVEDDKGYYITDFLDNQQSQVFNTPIYEYNTRVIITKSDSGEYKLYNYSHEDLFPNDTLDQCNIYKSYVIKLSNRKLEIYNEQLGNVIKSFYEDGQVIEYTLKGSILDIKVNGDNYKKIDLDNQDDLM